MAHHLPMGRAGQFSLPMIGVEKSPRKHHLNSSLLPLGVLLRKPYLLGFSELEISQERPGKCFHGDIKLAVHPAIFENFHGQSTASP